MVDFSCSKLFKIDLNMMVNGHPTIDHKIRVRRSSQIKKTQKLRILSSKGEISQFVDSNVEHKEKKKRN